MAQVVTVLQSDPTLLRCQLHRLDHAVDLNVSAGDAVGVGYYENGKVLLRKRPVTKAGLTLESLGQDVKSDLFVAAWHRTGPNGFREEDTAPNRFRNWLFAGKGQILPVADQADLLSRLPDFLQRGLVQSSESELAFFSTLAHIQAEVHQLDHLDLDADVVARALMSTLGELDQRAAQVGIAPPQTSALISNGRLVVAVRRGPPLFYGLLEGLLECPVCGIDRTTTDRDPRVRAHRTLKAVALTTRAKKDGIQWIEVPEGHVITISRTLAVKIAPLSS